MKLNAVINNGVILHPETVIEAGLMQWLSMRCKGKRMILMFDTHVIDGNQFPALWIMEEI